MIGLAAVDVLGLFVEPAVVCVVVALVVGYGVRRGLDVIGINHLVWNRALFDFSILVALASLLILALR